MMKQAQRWWILAIVVVAMGTFFRFANLDHKVYWHDEVINSVRVSGYSLESAADDLLQDSPFSIVALQKYQYPGADKTPLDMVHSLATLEPQNPPLYYLFAWLWFKLWGHSVTVSRSLSAFISLLALPLVYGLGRELFEDSHVGLLAMSLLAVSPFHVLYAQEARPFSLWTVTTLLSSILLLQALKRNHYKQWGLYIVSLVLGLYTFPFTLFVLASHGLYMLAIARFRITQTVLTGLGAMAVSLVAFSPWLVFIALNSNQIDPWRSRSVSFTALAKTWLGNLTRLFVDFNLDSTSPVLFVLPWVLVSLGLIAYALFVLIRLAPRKATLFLLLLVSLTAAALMLPDLFAGGRRSTVSRYFIPYYLGLQLTVAYLLAKKSTYGRYQSLWKGFTVAILGMGIASCLVSLNAQTWWTKPLNLEMPAIAAQINQIEQPLILSNRVSFELIELSYLLKPDTQMQLISKSDVPAFDEPLTLLLAYPDEELKQNLLDNGYQTDTVQGVGNNQLFQVSQ